MGVNLTKCQISEYWMKNCPYDEAELNIDLTEMPFHCWNCGHDMRIGKSNDSAKTRLQRCHIIPKSLGGENIPSNYVLLCHICHREAPNVRNSQKMWEWIKSNYVPFSIYDSYNINKGLALFEQQKGYSFLTKVLPLIKGDISDIIKKEIDNVSFHACERLNASTILGLFEIIESKYTTPS